MLFRSACAFVFFAVSGFAAEAFRPPAVPLVAVDPYFSVWSMADHLTDAPTKHWTGKPQPLTSIIRIDGASYRLMGTDRQIPAMHQLSVDVEPTRTLYDFEDHGIRVELTFMTPLLPHDLAVFSRPVTYITWQARSTDGTAHAVSLYFDASSLLAVNVPEQEVTGGRFKIGDSEVLRLGSKDQPVLGKSGDDLRIDWGYLYLAPQPGTGGRDAIAGHREAVTTFLKSGSLPAADDLNLPRMARVDSPVLAEAFDLGSVSAQPVSRFIALAYDDLFSIEYFYRRLRPSWRSTGMTPETLIQAALRDYPRLTERCEQFDHDLLEDLRNAGGDDYARIGALAYRQAIAAQKLVTDIDGTLFLFPKENFSNGCIGTVDVIYPASPILMLFSTDLLKASITPVLEYARMPRWKFPFAPHDLGTYPLADGQVYGGGEKTEEDQMPVEESANMILMVAGVAKNEGNASYAERYWPELTKWAEYLKAKGLDPENQLCTDDFAGHLAHNANLSLKAILALGAYGQLCERTGHTREAAEYSETARKFAAQWMKLDDDGDHYRLTFDRPGTWSQKYNLVWDRILGLHLFPASVAEKEIAYYKTKQNQFGLPLDSRKSYTKLDWLFWSATLANSKADFEALIHPAFEFANQSPSRVPLTDWYDTVTAKQEGFQARSVVGGVFVKLLSEEAVAAKWRGKAIQ